MNFSPYLFQPQRNPPTPNDGETPGGFLMLQGTAWSRKSIPCGEGVCPHPFPSLTPTKRWKCRCTPGCKGDACARGGRCVGHPCTEVGEDESFPSLHLPSRPPAAFPFPTRTPTREAAERFHFVSFRATRVGVKEKIKPGVANGGRTEPIPHKNELRFARWALGRNAIMCIYINNNKKGGRGDAGAKVLKRKGTDFLSA